MCTPWCLDFARNLSPAAIQGQRVIEIGSRDVNGSCRAQMLAAGAHGYLGTDITPGLGVDYLCDGLDLPERLGTEIAGVVVCTEVLEHVPDWQDLIESAWSLLQPGGHLLLTTRSLGFPYHEYPVDCWRFSVQNLYDVFCNQEIVALVSDPTQPGVGIVVRKTGPLRPREYWADCCSPVIPPGGTS